MPLFQSLVQLLSLALASILLHKSQQAQSFAARES